LGFFVYFSATEMETKYKILTGVIAIIFIVVLVWMDKNGDKKISKKYDFLIHNGDFDIGTVTGDARTRVGNNYIKSSIMFNYQNNNYWIESGEASFLKKFNMDWTLNFLSTEKGDRFLVLYENGNEQNSILCLDKPIKNETDFEKYKQEILKWREAEKN